MRWLLAADRPMRCDDWRFSAILGRELQSRERQGQFHSQRRSNWRHIEGGHSQSFFSACDQKRRDNLCQPHESLRETHSEAREAYELSRPSEEARVLADDLCAPQGSDDGRASQEGSKRRFILAVLAGKLDVSESDNRAHKGSQHDGEEREPYAKEGTNHPHQFDVAKPKTLDFANAIIDFCDTPKKAAANQRANQ